MIQLIIFVIIVLCSIALMIRWMVKDSYKLDLRFKNLKTEVDNAKTIEEIDACWIKLIELSETGWHKIYGTRILVMKTILETKYKMLNVVC